MKDGRKECEGREEGRTEGRKDGRKGEGQKKERYRVAPLRMEGKKEGSKVKEG